MFSFARARNKPPAQTSADTKHKARSRQRRAAHRKGTPTKGDTRVRQRRPMPPSGASTARRNLRANPSSYGATGTGLFRHILPAANNAPQREPHHAWNQHDPITAVVALPTVRSQGLQLGEHPATSPTTASGVLLRESTDRWDRAAVHKKKTCISAPGPASANNPQHQANTTADRRVGRFGSSRCKSHHVCSGRPLVLRGSEERATWGLWGGSRLAALVFAWLKRIYILFSRPGWRKHDRRLQGLHRECANVRAGKR